MSYADICGVAMRSCTPYFDAEVESFAKVLKVDKAACYQLLQGRNYDGYHFEHDTPGIA